MAASMAEVAKINTGIYSGKVSKLNNTPPLPMPTVNATPIAPSKLKIGVPSSKVKNTALKATISKLSSTATNGDNNSKGKPVNNQ